MGPDDRIIRIENAILTIEHIFRTMTDRSALITMPVGPDGITLHAICESIRAERAAVDPPNRPVDRSA